MAVRTIQVPGRHGSPPLTADVWYPAATRGGPRAAYGIAGVSYRSINAAAATAPVAGRRFPLVAFSHGYGGIRFQSSFLTELLASHGFVVASADHPGSTVVDEALGTVDSLQLAASHRPADLEALVEGVERVPATAASVDASKVAVVGHSLGGTAALAVGAQAPGTGPALAHPAAVVALAPASELLSDATLRADRVPTLLMAGAADQLTPPDQSVRRPLALVSGRLLASVLLDRSGHYSFSDLCRFSQVLRESSLPAALTQQVTANEDATCGAGALAPARAQALIGGYTVAFLLAHVSGDARYATPAAGLADATLTLAPPR